jgi:hypothetical protein
MFVARFALQACSFNSRHQAREPKFEDGGPENLLPFASQIQQLT